LADRWESQEEKREALCAASGKTKTWTQVLTRGKGETKTGGVKKNILLCFNPQGKGKTSRNLPRETDKIPNLKHTNEEGKKRKDVGLVVHLKGITPGRCP